MEPRADTEIWVAVSKRDRQEKEAGDPSKIHTDLIVIVDSEFLLVLLFSSSVKTF